MPISAHQISHIGAMSAYIRLPLASITVRRGPLSAYQLAGLGTKQTNVLMHCYLLVVSVKLN